MYNNKTKRSCYNCYNCVELNEICFCLAHRIRIEPVRGLSCYKWMVDDLHDNIPDNNAMDGSVKKNDQTVHNKE